MNEAQHQTVSHGDPAVLNGEIDAYRLLFRTVKQQKKTVIRIVGIVTVIMLIYVLIMPQTFTSTVSLLPPQQDSKSMG